jgi:hypothetical protein
MKKKCLLFSILLIFFVLPLFSQSENVKTSDRIVINMKNMIMMLVYFLRKVCVFKFLLSSSHYLQPSIEQTQIEYLRK